MELVRIETEEEIDNCPDLLYYGTYGTKKQKWAIRRKTRDPDACEYFYPAFPPTESMSREEKREAWKMCVSDYERIEKYGRGELDFFGIRAVAIVKIADSYHRIATAGLWGIGSDEGDAYINQVKEEELDILRIMLEDMGFTKKDIENAMTECVGKMHIWRAI